MSNQFQRLIFLFFLTFVLFSVDSLAQRTIQITVVDSADHQSVFGAYIKIDNSSKGIVSNIDGVGKIAIDDKTDSAFTVEAMQYGLKRVLIFKDKDNYKVELASASKELKEVEVSSTRSNSRIDDIPTRIELIGADDLEEENGIKPGNISSILGDIAGIQLQQVSSITGNTYARIQGLNGRYTQILRDGIPLFGGFSGSLGLLQIPPLDLKQVELIKGSSSTLYGGDAIGGIINLITKQPGVEKELKATVNQTTLKETNTNVYYANSWEKIGLTFFAGQTLQKNSDVNGDGLTDLPDLNSVIVHPKLFFNFSSKSKLDIGYSLILDSRKGGDVNYLNKKDLAAFHLTNNSKRHLVDIHYKYQWNSDHDLNIKMSGSEFENKLWSSRYNFIAQNQLFFSELSYRLRIKKFETLFGINYNSSKFTPVTVLFPIDTTVNNTSGGFIQSTFKANPKLTIEAGVRADMNSLYGSFVLPRLSLLYRFNNYFTGRINGGYGYKNPDPLTFINIENDLEGYSKNPNLLDEFSRGINSDINFKKIIADKITLTLNQAFYFTAIDSPIDNLSMLESRIYLVNEPKPINTLSLQTYTRLSFDKAELYFSYVFTDAVKKYDPIYPILKITPRHNIASTFVYEWNETFASGLEANYFLEQRNQDYVKVKNYLFMAAMIRCKLSKVTLVLNCENLFDFRQSNYEALYDGTRSEPRFRSLWAPIDGRVINLSIKYSIF